MDRRVVIAGGIVAVALAVFGARLAINSGAKTSLDDALAHLPPGVTVTHGAVTYNGLTGEARVGDLVASRNGKVFLTAADVSVSGIGALDQTGTPRRIGEIILHDATAGVYKHIKRVVLTGLYPATLRQVMDPAAYPGGKAAWTDKRPVLDNAEVTGIDGSQTTAISTGKSVGQTVETTFSVGASTFGGVRLAQLASPPDYTVPVAAVVAALEQAGAEDSSSLKDVRFSVAGPASATGHIARMASGRFDSGRLDDVSADDIAITTSNPPGAITVGGMSGHGLDMSRLLASMPAIIADPGKPHPELLTGMHLKSGELHGMKIDYQRGPLVTLDSLRVGDSASGAADRDTAVTLRALTVQTSNRPLDANTRAALDTFGMADFTADLDEAGTYDDAAHTLTLRHGDLDLHHLGSLHLRFVLSGVPAGGMGTPQQAQQAALNARLNSASLTWNDASLTGRLFAMAAARQHMTAEQVRAGLAIPIATLPMLMPEQPDAAQQVGAFLDGRHSLAITLAPPIPVGLPQWNETPPMARATLLGAHVAGN